MCAARLLILLLLLAGGPCGLHAGPAEADQTAPVAPLPLADIAAEADTLEARLDAVRAYAADDAVMQAVEDDLPILTREVDYRLSELQRIVAQRPPLDMLRALEAGWRTVRETLADWSRELGRREARIARDLADLDRAEGVWRATRAALPAEAPPEMLARLDAQLAAITQARVAAERHRAALMALQGRVAAQEARVGTALRALRQAREDTLSRLLVPDSPALWSRELRARPAQPLAAQARESLAAQRAALRDYVQRREAPFLLHAFLLIAIAAGFYAARGPLSRWAQHDPRLARTALVFHAPLATALVVTLFAMRWIYPQAPRLLWAVFGALALIPAAYILRRLVDRELRPTLYLLVGFYFVDQVRAVLAATDLLPRLLFLGEMIAAALFAGWLLRHLRTARAAPVSEPLRLAMKGGAAVALTVCAAALAANVTGHVRLANLLGNAMLLSAYFALILYVTVAIADGLIEIGLRLRPVSALGMVGRHGDIVRHWLRRALVWGAVVAWVLFALERLTVRERLIAGAEAVLTAHASVGSLQVSLGDVLAFALTVWAAILFSRLVRFFLEEDVYPRVTLARGLPYAISTMAHYAILVVGFFAAMAALGLDMTKATILAGAFTVGVGFGLQNIFNNFVSGIILLFERPVKVGDVIEIDASSTGVVERIGIRASVIRTPSGAELIVPNGRLISDRFTNWTLSSRSRSIEVPVAVVLGSDLTHAIATLERTAREHPRIVDVPAPRAIVTRLGPDWIGLELRGWTDDAAQWLDIRSDLAVRVSQALPAAGITLR